MNGISWLFYGERNSLLAGAMALAEGWARRAVALAPTNAASAHTLACILAATGQAEEALPFAKAYLQDPALVEKSLEDAIEVCTALAAAGQAAAVLELILESPAQKYLEPLVVGLKLCLGEKVKTAPEILEVAKDLVERIKRRQPPHPWGNDS